jgi:hypothetical protein
VTADDRVAAPRESKFVLHAVPQKLLGVPERHQPLVGYPERLASPIHELVLAERGPREACIRTVSSHLPCL